MIRSREKTNASPMAHGRLFVFFRGLGIFAARLIMVTGLSILDRLLGTVFGVTRGIILVLVCVFVLRQLVPPQDLQWLQQSQFMPHLDVLGQWAQDMFAEANGGPPPVKSN